MTLVNLVPGIFAIIANVEISEIFGDDELWAGVLTGHGLIGTIITIIWAKSTQEYIGYVLYT